MSRPTLHVACAADRRYVPHSAAMLHSVLTSSPAIGVHVHYLHGDDLTAADRDRLRRMTDALGGAISFWPIGRDRVAGLPEKAVVTLPMWYRIFLPELLPSVDRVLYLDVDTIAVASLEPLTRLDLGDHYLAAVENVMEPWNENRPASLGIPPAQGYFNSGVLLLNTALLRRDGAAEAIREYALANRDRISWPDQDALNAVLGPRRLRLHPRYNLMNSVLLFPQAPDVLGEREVAEARADPAIRHFEGPALNKPWHLLASDEDRALYLSHRRQTPWPRLRPSGASPRTVATWARRRLVRP